MDKVNTFESRREKFTAREIKLSKRYNFLSGLRITSFVGMLVLAVYFANLGVPVAVAVTILVFILIFGFLVTRHNKVIYEHDDCRNHVKINKQEVQRLKGDFQTLEEGKEFLNEKHFYARDMDIFGRNSLYQLLNRTNTPSGKSILASWLLHRADRSAIIQRQEAVKEISPEIDWRQRYQSAGMFHKEEHKDFQSVIDWINQPEEIKNRRLVNILAYALPVIMITLILLNLTIGLSILYAAGLAMLHAIWLRSYVKKVTDITESTGKGLQTLKAYANLISIIEDSEFKSVLLRDLQKTFTHKEQKASVAILRLQRILRFLYARANMFYFLFNVVLLFDIHLLLRAYDWKRRQKDDISQWFQDIGQFEAINSLAGLAYANPDFTFPEISDSPFVFKAAALGHPLIHKSERVNNDLELKGEGTIALITGSNMSGKSTFLRTVGVNMALAYCGAPVCASRLDLSLMQLFTSMRTEDNLEEHISSFYAELQRIKMLLKLVDEGKEPVMFMLDEILKGTNSNDRHAGAEALIRQLSQHKIMGFVSTHDLVLGELADELQGVENYSFNSRIEGERIIFDYKMEHGICHSFNASKLMEQIGINLNLKK